MDSTKRCQDCGEEKPLDDFYSQGKSNGARMPYCKTCDNTRRRERKRLAHQPDYQPIRHHRKIEDGKKRCSRCGERKPLEEYVISNGSEHGYCKPCHAEWAREYRKRPEKRAKMVRRSRATAFGLSLEEYDILMQRTTCAICGGPGGVHGLCIDHSHAEGGGVRDLLCTSCNAGIAMFNDDPERLRSAIAYLEKWATVSASTSVGASTS